MGRVWRFPAGHVPLSEPPKGGPGVQPRAFFVLANCLRWVLAGLRPASTHRRLFLCTGRECRNPAKARTRPPPIRVHLSTSVSYAGTFHSPRKGLPQI